MRIVRERRLHQDRRPACALYARAQTKARAVPRYAIERGEGLRTRTFHPPQHSQLCAKIHARDERATLEIRPRAAAADNLEDPGTAGTACYQNGGRRNIGNESRVAR